MYATAVARMLIARRWKGDKIPTKLEWQANLFEYIDLAKRTGKIKNQTNQEFNKEWD